MGNTQSPPGDFAYVKFPMSDAFRTGCPGALSWDLNSGLAIQSLNNRKCISRIKAALLSPAGETTSGTTGIENTGLSAWHK
jgi:hypothetical protein